MAKLHEYKAKQILARYGIEIPKGEVVYNAESAFNVAERLGGKCVIKAQIHSTSRASKGGIKFAKTAEETRKIASEILGSRIDNNLCEALLVEEKVEIEKEFYLGFIIDTVLKRPVLLFSEFGGSGIEDRAETTKRLVCSVRHEPTIEQIKTICSDEGVAAILQKLYRLAREYEARSAEINPLVLSGNRSFVALDCRISVDDYAVFRHEDLDIEVARELGHTPTRLEKLAWQVEKNDYRGTFYFVEIDDEFKPGIKIGFHGAGGGGSMASLDAAERNGLRPACYVDTSGNPPASKIYRAARIILSIKGIRGYFLSGSGVASQEQFILARGVLKAFLEERPKIPAVLRLGGNGEEVAKQIVENFGKFLPMPIEAYQKNHSADFCASRLRSLIEEANENSNFEELPAFSFEGKLYEFKTKTGRIIFNHSIFEKVDASYVVEACPVKILKKDEQGLPILAIDPADAERGKCIECLACEFASWEKGFGGVKVEFPIEGLEDGNSN
ncbi:MAG: acetate--CoA ligase family protein [Pyrinomonadaceae bacterium]|nr:acetate--CoA ligase family protein [Pyrinomonadaceae bacterium]MDW8304796.1 ATP-grasp domain-containing protein [Acidobacteriota bacterium]